MSNDSQLDSSIVALVSLASGIASKHPAMGLCQLEKLRHMGVPESQINTVVEIARNIRDEASEKIDLAFDEKMLGELGEAASSDVNEQASCCSPTQRGQERVANKCVKALKKDE